MKQPSFLLSSLLAAGCCWGLLTVAPAPVKAQSSTWLKNYRGRMQQQWDKPAGERFDQGRSRFGFARMFSRMAGRAADKIRSGASHLGGSVLIGGANDDMLGYLMRKRVAEQRKRRAELLARQQAHQRDQLARHVSAVQRLGVRTRGWANRYLSPWALTGGFGSTVRRASRDIHTRWEARLRLVHKRQPRLPLKRKPSAGGY